MIKGKTISLIIPCRNEEKIIGKLIRRLPKYIDDIIVVDNKSKDNTVTVARQAGARVFKENRAVNGIGYGFAHQTGLAKAKGDYIFAMDGDDTYPASEIKNIINYMEQNSFDILSCNRLPLKNAHAISRTRKLGIQILNLEVLLLFGYPIKDTLTGMWGMKREVAAKLNLVEGGWDLSPEIKINAILHPEIKFGEYHINHFTRDDSAVSKQQIWKTGFNHAVYILKKRLNTLPLVDFLTRPLPYGLAALRQFISL